MMLLTWLAVPQKQPAHFKQCKKHRGEHWCAGAAPGAVWGQPAFFIAHPNHYNMAFCLSGSTKVFKVPALSQVLPQSPMWWPGGCLGYLLICCSHGESCFPPAHTVVRAAEGPGVGPLFPQKEITEDLKTAACPRGAHTQVWGHM